MTLGIFVTATDTGVGKTLIARSLTAALVARGMRVAVMKPVETGCPLRTDPSLALVDGIPGALDSTAREALNRLAELAGPPAITVSTKTPPEALAPSDALALSDISNCHDPLELINPYRFAPAVAPAVAADLAERPIVLDQILDRLDQLAQRSDIVVVEGAGGLMVPLTQSDLIIDLLARTGFPALVVARSELGTINHSLLTVAQLRQRRIPLAGVVLNRLTKRPRPEEAANPHQIERFAGDVVLGVMPFVDDDKRADSAYLARRFAAHVDLDRLLQAAHSAPQPPDRLPVSIPDPR